jgi:hypothetical protein
MRKLLVTLSLVISTMIVISANFDDRGVIKMLSGSTMVAGNTKTFGVQDVSDRTGILNIMVYGATTDDSLNVAVEILGMMSPNLSDTSKAIQIYSGTNHSSGGAVTFADTLDDDEMVPYLYARVTNNDVDSTVVLDAWIYMIQKEQTVILQK